MYFMNSDYAILVYDPTDPVSQNNLKICLILKFQEGLDYAASWYETVVRMRPDIPFALVGNETSEFEIVPSNSQIIAINSNTNP